MLHDNQTLVEKVVLIGVATQHNELDMDYSIQELEALADTAGAVTVAKSIQNRESIHPATYIGKGKIEEIKLLIKAYDATGVVCDDELSPSQHKNLEEMLETKVMDRTMLILDIFAKRARTKEGNIQVELAQLKYRMTRLTGMGKVLSRLGGGIGTRGPGEKKLETDRRYIRNRISNLKKELLGVSNHRTLIRENRKKKGLLNAAIVGYTNAGKSSLLNTLTHASVLEEDQLFATLDPTTRQLELPSGLPILLTDTVGFIRKLPHHLIEAFQSTLEEAVVADLLIHVVDCTHPNADKQIELVYETLERLGAVNKPIITLLNKIDLPEADTQLKDNKARYKLRTSIKDQKGLDKLMECLELIAYEDKELVKCIIPYDQASVLNKIRQSGPILAEDYRNDGIYIEAYVDKSTKHLL